LKQLFSKALVVLALTFPVAALADVTGTPTLSAGSNLNLDTGATVTSGGDISWNGTSIAVVGSAKDVDLASTPVASEFNGPSGFTLAVQLGQESASSYAAAFGSLLVTSSITPKVNDILVVKTNGGNYAAVLVLSIGSSIQLQFDSLAGGGGGAPSGPNITNVLNNYSYIPAGFPNSGIPPGTLFTIFGTGLANAPAGNVTLSSSASPGIPTTLAGATLSVTVGGKTVTPGMYYATPTQIAAVLPSNTPTGSATLTVSYNNATSNAYSFQVVPYALGLDTYYGTGNGLVTATSPTSGALYNYTNSAKPGDTIVLWGSGLGADTADSDTVFTSSPHSVNTPLQIYFGGVPGTVLYAGSSGYPGLDQIDVTIPANAPTGCYVGVVGVTGNGASQTVSNFGSLTISSSGGQCNDSIFGISGSTISTLSGKTTVRSGDVFVGQLIEPTSGTDNTPKTNNIAFASFSQDTGTSYASSNNSAFSLGSCSVNEIISSSTGSTGTSVGLDAGTINLTGPAGTYGLSTFATGSYEASLPAGAITSSGGAFTFNNGSGGVDVKGFNTTINLPNPLLSWTNQSADATVNRAQGIQITWTGGASGSYVLITGSSSNDTTGASGSFTCITTQNALSFTVPGYVTGALPAGSGRLDVENIANYATFTASGLDVGIDFGFTGASINSLYQ
jgi:uncharacterized protein (TIGR03437 family)